VHSFSSQETNVVFIRLQPLTHTHHSYYHVNTSKVSNQSITAHASTAVTAAHNYLLHK